MIRELQDFADGKTKRLMIFCPPRHGKTLLCSILFPSYIFYRYYQQHIMLLTYGHDLSKAFGQKLRDVLRSPAWQEIANSRLRSDTRGKNEFMLTDGSEFHGMGRDGAVTGKGANWLLCDDLIKNRKEADSRTIREDILSGYNTVVSTRLQDKFSAILHLITRWRKNDLLGILLEEDAKQTDPIKKENWRVVRFAAIAEEDEEWEGTNGKLYLRRRGVALWPEKYDLNALGKIREQLGPEFTGLYQQRPAALEGELFKRKDWGFYKKEDLPAPEDVKVALVSLDTAFKVNERADFSVGLAGVVGMNGNLYLLDCFREKVEFNELKEYTKDLIDLYRPDYTLIEDKGAGTSLYQELVDDPDASLISGFEPIAKKWGKEDCAQACKAVVQRHKVLLPEEVLDNGCDWFDENWVELFIEEHAEFPNSTHDDMVDSFTQMVMFSRKHGFFEPEDEDYSLLGMDDLLN